MMRRILVLGTVWLVANLLAGCATPVLNSLTANTGPERTVVSVEGSNLLLSEVVWDAGLPSETTVPGGFLGGYMFSVPPGATVGSHPVVLRNATGTSSTLNFSVIPPVPFGAPRVDRVSLLYAGFTGTDVNPILYVEGGNVDVGATVQLNGRDVATASHRALHTELYGTNPNFMGFPIYHYVSMLAIPGPQVPGSSINITVRNLDGQVSLPVSYTLPVSEATLDRDGDNLLDVWETEGFDANGDGIIDINLRALGAHPLRPDILVEVDIMNGLTNPPVASTPGNPGTFEMAQSMFRAAPILNPLGQEGINLILDTSGTVPFNQMISFGTILPGPPGTADFTTLKAANFDNIMRDRIYHYAVWGNMLVAGYSGVSDIDFGGSGAGDDFVVTFDDFSTSYQTIRSQVETFVHELGHNLGQRHGGDTHSQYKPNYWSAMAYAWQLRSGQTNAWRRSKPTCTPIYWADPAATEVNGAAPATANAITDYSQGMGPTLRENNNSLNEPTGVCGIGVYWNADLDTTDTGLSLDADDNGASTETLNDLGNWRALNYRGPEANGDLTP